MSEILPQTLAYLRLAYGTSNVNGTVVFTSQCTLVRLILPIVLSEGRTLLVKVLTVPAAVFSVDQLFEKHYTEFLFEVVYVNGAPVVMGTYGPRIRFLEENWRALSDVLKVMNEDTGEQMAFPLKPGSLPYKGRWAIISSMDDDETDDEE